MVPLASALEHLLAGQKTISPGKGLFWKRCGAFDYRRIGYRRVRQIAIDEL